MRFDVALCVTVALLALAPIAAADPVPPHLCGTYVRAGSPPNGFKIFGVRVQHISCNNTVGTLMVFDGRKAPAGWQLRRGVIVSWSNHRQNVLSQGRRHIWYQRDSRCKSACS
jgi:hypothetical protein